MHLYDLINLLLTQKLSYTIINCSTLFLPIIFDLCTSIKQQLFEKGWFKNKLYCLCRAVNANMCSTHSIHIRTASSWCLLSTLLNWLNLFMGCLGRATCTLYSISAHISQEGIKCTKVRAQVRAYCIIYLLCAVPILVKNFNQEPHL